VTSLVPTFVTTYPGLEPVLGQELAQLGLAVGRVEEGGVLLDVRPEEIYRLNLALRTASRVVVRIGGFHARTFPELERHARKIPWESFVAPNGRVHLRVTAKKSRLNHERAIVERLERSVAERVPGVGFLERRADVLLDEREVGSPVEVQRFIVRLARDRCTISADSSGPLLHRRGYRTDGGKAPLRETLAAGLLLAAGWDGATALVDPLCGSGTIPIEGALLARRIPPGLNRRFAFESWPGFDRPAFDRIRSELVHLARERALVPIAGSDRDRGAIDRAAANSERAGVRGDVTWRECALSAIEPPAATGLVATNPPYGARIGERHDLRDLYAQLGHVLRRKMSGWQVALFSADRALERQVGIAWRELLATDNGGIKVRIVAGSVA
jgi:putative N6-adenine-specific DNA methylase